MQYRRAKAKGGTYFFTVNLVERNKKLLVEHINELRMAYKQVNQQYPFITNAIVLPDHLHAIWTLPKNDLDYSTRWRLIKFHFSKSMLKTERINASRISKSERGIWQRRFWEHQIHSESDFIRHMDYVYYNPVKHGYVNNVTDWQYSSFHRDVNKGLYSREWGKNSINEMDIRGA